MVSTATSTRFSLAAPNSGSAGSGLARGHRVQAPRSGRWAVVGQGQLAEAVAAAWPFKNMQLVQWPGYDREAPLVDGVIEAVGGVAPALDVSLTALARGVPVVTANALLLAAHGSVLTAASSGAGAGMLGVEGALLGSVPVQGLLGTAEELVVTFGGAADAVLQRMRHRGEEFAVAEKAVRQSGIPLDDVGGKQTLARALALHGIWRGQWLNPAQQARVALEAVSAADVSFLQKQGLGLRYGAVLRPEEFGTSLAVGSLALADGLLPLEGTTLVSRSGLGQQVLSALGGDVARAVAGMLHDVQDLSRRAGGVTLERRQLRLPLGGSAMASRWFYVRQGKGAGKMLRAGGWLQGPDTVVIPVAGDAPLAVEVNAAGRRVA